MPYVLCLKCGHEACLFEKSEAGKFRLFCQHGIIKSLAHFDLCQDEAEFECSKCAGIEVKVNDWPVRKVKR